jgi:hypothetical protein
MDYLNDEQKALFAANNSLVGLGPTEFTAQLSDEELAALPSTRIMSNNPDESHFPVYQISVASIAEMRKIAGFPEEYVDTGGEQPDYPPPPTAEEISLVTGYSSGLKLQINEDLKHRIEKAAQAYVMGNPDRVREYEPLINAALFPGQVTVFTGDTLGVPADALHIIKGDNPTFLNYGKITVGKNASISIQKEVTVNAQVFIQE